MRVFLDTNVLVAAFATHGLCEDIFRVTLAEHEMVLSETVLTEFERVLVQKLHFPPLRAKTLSSFLQRQANVVKPAKPAVWPIRDPDDRWVLSAAIEGAADFLVTGDRDLLEVAAEVTVPIVSPRAFWEQLH
jgi:putative PIN family toxin of toxin-antitoxin system